MGARRRELPASITLRVSGETHARAGALLAQVRGVPAASVMRRVFELGLELAEAQGVASLLVASGDPTTVRLLEERSA